MGTKSVESENVVRGRRINFLGYCFTKDNVRMRKSMKKNFARKVKRIKSRKRNREIRASYWGWCKWGDCKNLWRTITNNDMSFADKGIKQSDRTKDGKKFFDVKETRLMDILNVPITVVDFETNVKTKQGEGRYCVLFEQNGQRSKFITNCYNLKDVLDQAREAENNGQKIFPVENVIVKRRSLGDGKSAYYFEE
jgi:hypothetical protein